jgi:hypothetical protein
MIISHPDMETNIFIPQVALMINGESPGIPRQLMGPKPVRGLCQRLKGMYMYVCMYIFICIFYLYINMNIYTYVYTYIHVYIYIYVYTYR